MKTIENALLTLALAAGAAGLLACAAGREPATFDLSELPPQTVGYKSAQEELDLVMAKVKSGELPKIEFEFDSSKIKLESHPTLDAIAELLLRYPRLKLMIRAHTDAIGTEDYNLALSERRAESVKTYLVIKGLWPTYIRFRGLGFSQPIADNSTEEGRARNRRVEFRVTYRDWVSVY